jgi:drug/metabolite transporter (DMT)-like permease
MTYLLAAVLGLSVAGAWVVYIRAIAQQRAARAALADLTILLLGSLGVQVWAWGDERFGLFAAFDAGAALGTYIVVRRGIA